MGFLIHTICKSEQKICLQIRFNRILYFKQVLKNLEGHFNATYFMSQKNETSLAYKYDYILRRESSPNER